MKENGFESFLLFHGFINFLLKNLVGCNCDCISNFWRSGTIYYLAWNSPFEFNVLYWLIFKKYCENQFWCNFWCFVYKYIIYPYTKKGYK